MRGSLLVSTREFLIAKQKPEVWSTVLAAAGYPPRKTFMPVETVSDIQFMTLIEAVAKELKINMQQTWDELADHWINVYSPRVSPGHFGNIRSAREFLLNMDSVHRTIQSASQGVAKPPAFSYEEHADGALSITYDSSRNMIGYFTGLIKAVGKYFNQPATVIMKTANTAYVRFG